MPGQNAVYYLFFGLCFICYKMMFYNMILLMTGHSNWIMTGHYPNFALGKLNARSHVRFQQVISLGPMSSSYNI